MCNVQREASPQRTSTNKTGNMCAWQLPIHCRHSQQFKLRNKHRPTSGNFFSFVSSPLPVVSYKDKAFLNNSLVSISYIAFQERSLLLKQADWGITEARGNHLLDMESLQHLPGPRIKKIAQEAESFQVHCAAPASPKLPLSSMSTHSLKQLLTHIQEWPIYTFTHMGWILYTILTIPTWQDTICLTCFLLQVRFFSWGWLTQLHNLPSK